MHHCPGAHLYAGIGVLQCSVTQAFVGLSSSQSYKLDMPLGPYGPGDPLLAARGADFPGGEEDLSGDFSNLGSFCSEL